MVIRLILAVLCAAVLGGCDVAPRALFVAPPPASTDSVRWVALEADGTVNERCTALTWPSGTMNLWASGNFLCQTSTSAQAYSVSYGVVYRATLPAFWQTGDTIRGAEATAAPDSNTVTGGTMWAVVKADTMEGRLMTAVQTVHCGARVDTLPFRLVRNAQ